MIPADPGVPLATPLRFRPLIKRARWGGTRLGSQLGKDIGTLTDASESWELVDHGNDQSVVAEGPWVGWTLQQLLSFHRESLLGRGHRDERFPLLIKFLDAHDSLSVQVHPNDAQAARYQAGELGKTEAWVILSAEPGAVVYAGLKSGVTRNSLREALATGTVAECLHRMAVVPGDVVFIPAGTVHALGGGIVLAEIQQSSDLTFRLDDWGRLGADGKPRALHVAEALDCIDFERGPVSVSAVTRVRPDVEELVRCPQFVIRRHTLCESSLWPAHATARVLIVLSGECELQQGTETSRARMGETWLIPAASPNLTLRPSQPTVVLEASVPAAGTV